ncbi:alanine racemase [Nitrospirota bacterium]
MHRGLLARIDLDAARHNLRLLKHKKVIAVVKADAYGHGAVELSRAFVEAGADALAVAFVSEALELREAGITAPVLVLFDRSNIPDYFEHDLTPVIHDMKTAEAFSREAGKRNSEIEVHVKVDTGMGRMGFESGSDIQSILSLPNLNITGLMSHFSDADLADPEFTRLQLERFHEIHSTMGGKDILCHFANSAATLSYPEAHLDAVRPGIALYGASPFEGERSELDAVSSLRPVMSVSARVLSLRRMAKGSTISYGRTFTTERDTLTAVLAAGYADGVGRVFSNNADVILNGIRVPVLGRVCMDLMMVDATDVPGARDGDEAVLLGNDGDESISIWELAERAGTIPYEIMLSLGRNAQRTYV